jgi:hypothetical protein
VIGAVPRSSSSISSMPTLSTYDISSGHPIGLVIIILARDRVVRVKVQIYRNYAVENTYNIG